MVKLLKANKITKAIACVAIASLIALGGAAHAYECSNFVQTVGDVGRNPPVSATVAHDGAWFIVYKLQDGRTVNRADQYAIVDASNASRTAWDGRSLKYNVLMHGVLMRRYGDNHVMYVEDLYDSANPEARQQLHRLRRFARVACASCRPGRRPRSYAKR